MAFSVTVCHWKSLSGYVLVVVLGTGLAYPLARKKFPGKELLDILVTLPWSSPLP